MAGKAKKSPKRQDFSTSFTVDQTPAEVFAAINNVGGWWTGEPGVEGTAMKLGDVFTYRYGDLHYSKQKVTELVTGERIVWHVTDARLTHANDQTEWKGTDITFDLSKQGERTEVRFTHRGLVSDLDCFDACSSGWRYYVDGRLPKFIANGKASRRSK
jgi:hypothetical protein